MANIPEGFELVEDTVPEGFELVAESGMDFGDTLRGAADIAGVAATGLGQQLTEGLSGIGGLVMGRGVDESVANAQALGALVPQAELGEPGQQLIQSLSERFNASPEIVQTIGREFMNLGQSVGDRVFDTTGSPLAATIARSLPEAIEAATGLKAAKALPGTIKAAESAIDGVVDSAKAQSPAKQKIAELLQQGSSDVSTAKFEIAGEPTTKLGRLMGDGVPKVQTSKEAVSAIKQGFDEGVIAEIKAAGNADKRAFKSMLDIMQRGKNNARFAATNRPSDVLGGSLMKRVRVIQGANRAAGKQLDSVAKNLRGKPIDINSAVDGFINDLSDIGISLSDDLTPNFKGSDIEGLAGPEAAINRIIARMKGDKAIDAHDVHRMKRFIDEQVTFGKNAEGLSGKTEGILKNFRRNLDQKLDSNFDEYNRINTGYSETIGALDALQEVAGRKMNLTGPNADKATGTLMRRVLSNAQSRITLLDSVEQIESVAKKFENFKGKIDPRAIDGPKLPSKIDDDLLSQVLFVEELESRFGALARTSLKGQVEQAVKQGPGAIVIDVVAKTAEKARGINDENAFKAMRDLLNK